MKDDNVCMPDEKSGRVKILPLEIVRGGIIY
jgi:hypothetical protein